MLAGRRILIILSGSIAAYKALELTRALRRDGAAVSAILTAAGARFVTREALAGITGERVHDDLWAAEAEIGHIRLARLPDLVVVAPASADLLAKMAHGLADDLASTVLLATRAPILVAPAMNPAMWDHPATRANIGTLRGRGVRVVGPGEGAMAEPESGPGRLAEPPEILDAIRALLTEGQPLGGRHAIVTSGPTHEPIDPVRYIANRSSGKQGHAIAAALAAMGARVTLVSGPVALPDPPGVTVAHVETAREMLAACEAALPADIAVLAAAVADWRVAREAGQKLKKQPGAAPPSLEMALNPDILATLAAHPRARPALVVGFAAETEHVVEHAVAKRARKGCDWIVANDVSGPPGESIMGGDANRVQLITEDGVEDWPRMPKDAVARHLALRIAKRFAP
ncbi:MAG: bifunctional phosphopantothenoylcysteine decarboxylase/phosphopantothenate--cysteine ligase CoaBC [Acetobacteraceae bacterium]|nr:bifunctional phosphopantothenoylcysteine decarboxylase/phosphopantothenate--cysteine ligase CoaBC [Acetobacteraceae bacterium]